MTNAELITALRNCSDGVCGLCPYDDHELSTKGCEAKLMHAAADALEVADRLLDQNTKRCEALRKQLREAHENYEKHLNELEAQLPKEGEWIHGRELGKEWMYDHCWVTYFEDWRCSNCGVVFEQKSKPKYHCCPNCGARMRKGEQE